MGHTPPFSVATNYRKKEKKHFRSKTLEGMDQPLLPLLETWINDDQWWSMMIHVQSQIRPRSPTTSIHSSSKGFLLSQKPESRKLRWCDLPSGYVKIAIENGHLWWIFPAIKWWFSIVTLVYQRVLETMVFLLTMFEVFHGCPLMFPTSNSGKSGQHNDDKSVAYDLWCFPVHSLDGKGAIWHLAEKCPWWANLDMQKQKSL